MASKAPELRNVLAKSKSPYLLQHKENPVAWQEFTPATIAKAKELNRPIFLSSGYSACHWCHVLAHESFEDEETARLMNDAFVNIKVDREERPDVDRMYMTYLQMTSGSGGWPMSIFMTPDLEPFFAGTYFPNSRFKALVGRISELWEEDREQCVAMGKGVIEQLRETGSGASSSRTPASLDQILATSPSQKVFQHLVQTNDPRYGGFSPGGPRSRGPKFPSCTMTLEPLARVAAHGLSSSGQQSEAREMAVKMLRAIWQGGIRDWIGGGVARYSVDERWIVPHFEKMLYDEAQLVTSALDFALLSTPEATNSASVEDLRKDKNMCFDLAANILEYSLRDLQSLEGGFWSAEDADSAAQKGAKKSEGAFYIWDKAEMDALLGSDADVVEYFFGVKSDGNVDQVHDMHGEMTGKNILYQAHSLAETALVFGLSESEVAEKVKHAGIVLKKHRYETRERPGLDDKILTSWNGLMVSALARAAVSLPGDHYPVASRCLPAAEAVVEFLQSRLWDPTTRTLSRSWREGKGPTGQTDDYAFLIRGLLDLYEATGKDRYIVWAVELQRRQDELFWDVKGGGYFASAPDQHVLVRMKDSQDGAEPSATSVSVHNLSRLSLLASNDFSAYEQRAEETYLNTANELRQVPRAFAYSVAGLMDLEKGYREFIVTGPRHDETTKALLQLIWGTYIPNKVLIYIDPSDPPGELAKLNETVKSLLDEKKPSLRVCESGVCGLPISEVNEARRTIGQKT